MTKLRQTLTGFVSAAAGLLLLPICSQASSYTFQTINNNTDPAFNQLLGINSAREIAGYYGDGSTVPNNGYMVNSPYAQANFTINNFPSATATQTQVTGINGPSSNPTGPTVVGFWGDAAGDNFGWVKLGTAADTTVATPAGETGNVNQLLSVNNSNLAVGFYTDSVGNAHGYMYNITTGTYSPITPAGATSTTAAGIANNGVIAGFFTDGTGTHGFVDVGGTITPYDAPGSTATMFLGVNSNGDAVGNYIDASDVSHGILYDYLTNSWLPIDDPNESASPAFGIENTVVNSLNDAGDLVGFYSDGANVDGFLAAAVPEPGSFPMTALAAMGLGLIYRAKRRRP